MFKLVIVATAIVLATPALATSRIERDYARCVLALIKSRGATYAIDHAGDTRCDRIARARSRAR